MTHLCDICWAPATSVQQMQRLLCRQCAGGSDYQDDLAKMRDRHAALLKVLHEVSRDEVYVTTDRGTGEFASTSIAELAKAAILADTAAGVG